MKRRIIRIDEEKCNGCGACAAACHEGAIQMVDGKARLVRADFCDGLGDCLPACPTGAICFEEREVPAYHASAAQVKEQKANTIAVSGCVGTRPKVIQRPTASFLRESAPAVSCLGQWPCQIKLVPPNAPYFEEANLLLAADCTAYAYANFHNDFMRNHITLIGCPKLDACDYTERITQILSQNNIRSIQILRMEVPCCAGLEQAVRRALQQSGKTIPSQVVTLSTDGRILE